MFAPSRPEKSPGLTDYPACDEQVQQLAREIWGDEPAPAEVTERRLGQGRVIWGGAAVTETVGRVRRAAATGRGQVDLAQGGQAGRRGSAGDAVLPARRDSWTTTAASKRRGWC